MQAQSSFYYSAVQVFKANSDAPSIHLPPFPLAVPPQKEFRVFFVICSHHSRYHYSFVSIPFRNCSDGHKSQRRPVYRAENETPTLLLFWLMDNYPCHFRYHQSNAKCGPERSIQRFPGVPTVAQQVMNPTGIHEDAGSIPGPTQ